MSAITCHVCGADDLQEIPGCETLRRVTSDCRPWSAGGRLFSCGACGCVVTAADDEWRREADEIYAGYAVYYQSGGAEQAVFDQGAGLPKARSRQLLERMSASVPPPRRGRLLDIGCGNGSLLRQFAELAPEWSLAGSEIDGRNRSVIESIPGVERLYTCAPGEIPGEFDMISLIHVIEHVVDPAGFLAALRGKLKPDGRFLIETPDFILNPFDLLIADHCSHFTRATFEKFLHRSGLEAAVVTNEWVPKEISALTGRGAVETRIPGGGMDVGVAAARAVQWLRDVLNAARGAAAAGRFGVFGTSIAGMWLLGELEDAVEFFVDEDPGRAGKTCMERPVFAPADAPKGASVFIALPGAIGVDVCRRLTRTGASVKCVLPPELPGAAASAQST